MFYISYGYVFYANGMVMVAAFNRSGRYDDSDSDQSVFLLVVPDSASILARIARGSWGARCFPCDNGCRVEHRGRWYAHVPARALEAAEDLV